MKVRIKVGWDVKRILPLLVLVVITVALGAMIISVVSSENSKAQDAWNEVLKMDKETAAQARQALALVDRLERVRNDYPEGSEEADALQVKIIDAWPSFAGRGSPGQVELPPAPVMRKQLKFYIGRG
jgi:hypothetical protein